MIFTNFNLNDRFEPIDENKKKTKFDNAVEGLRGLAALWVCHSHIILPLDPNYHPASIFEHFTVGREAVQIFFVLSGYVIGLTCKNTFSKNNAISYLLKRLIRLFPMYLLSIIISYVLIYPKDTWQVVLGNVFFLQNLIVPTVSNGALWSLNFEFVYYLVFLIIWKFRPKIALTVIGIITVMALTWIFNPSSNNIFSGYLVGWIFWLLGLFLAWRVPSNPRDIKTPILSLILIFLANKELRLGTNILDVLHLKNPGWADSSFGDLTSLAICGLLFAVVTNRLINTNVNRFLYSIAILMPLTMISYSFIKNHGFVRSDNYVIASIEIFLAIVLCWIRHEPSILNNLDFFGRISYGIYIFHWPIFNLVCYNFPVSGSLWSYLLRYISWAILTVSLSYLMDVKIQSMIRNWCKVNVFTRFALS
jgi:peptidoglycan/LPS O-acetylase OafA/YrhL